MSEQNKAVARKVFEEVMNKKNMAVIPQIVAPNFVGYQGAQKVEGQEGVKQLANMYLTAFPDAKMTVVEQLAVGDKVVTRWKATGTHRGDLMGVKASGKKVNITGITINRIANGKIVEEWEEFDSAGMMQQIGAAS